MGSQLTGVQEVKAAAAFDVMARPRGSLGSLQGLGGALQRIYVESQGT